MKILSANANGMRYGNSEKISQHISFCKRNKVNILLLIEINSKWNSISKDIMKNRLKELRRGVDIVFADSKTHEVTKSD